MTAQKAETQSDQAEPEASAGGYLNPWPSTTRGKLTFGYFAGLSVLYYVLISTVGTMSTRVFGVPILYWLTIAIYVTFAGGIYVLIQRPEARKSREAGV
ncbi:MAG: hypothetical protein ABEJ28_12790 [Salinigranum sp.]